MRSLPDNDSFMKVENGEQAHTGEWAHACILSVASHTRSTAGYISHLYRSFDPQGREGEVETNPKLIEFIDAVRCDFGNDVRMTVRGATYLLGKEVLGPWRAQHDAQRAHFLEILRTNGFPDEAVDVRWAEESTLTRLHFNSSNGTLREETHKL